MTKTAEVQEDDVNRICGNKEVADDFNEGGLSAVVCSEARLKGIMEHMAKHVMVELGGSCSFQGFVEKGKVGEQWVVVEVRWVQNKLLENGGD